MTRILVITTMRNEAPFVLEWIAHHKALGVTDFLVFTNECDDGTDLLLDQLAAAEEVLHVPQERGHKSVQWQALNAAWRHPVRQSVDWAICMDCDEFINLRAPFQNLSQMIAAAAEADAIVLPWRFFGHSNHLTFEDVPVTERFTRSVPEHVPFPLVTKFFKTLARVRNGPFSKLGVHRPKSKAASMPVARWLNGSGQAMPQDFAQNDKQLILPDAFAGRGWVQLNHYSLRSLEDFLVKRQRGLPNRKGKQVDALYWAERNFNTIEDRSISVHHTAMLSELDRLKALPGISAAHRFAVESHKSKIKKLLEDPEHVTFFTRLALLASSEPPLPGDASHLLQLTAKAWAKRER